MMRWWLAMMALLVGCAGVPKGLHPVGGFELERYLGRWYEIARLNHSFERGLTNVSAEYRLLPDGRVEVVNRGFDPAKNAWHDARGVARFQGARVVGGLVVSFFVPFYGALPRGAGRRRFGGVVFRAVLWRVQCAGARRGLSLRAGGGAES